MGSGSTKFSLKKAKPAMDIFMVMLVPNVYGFLDWSAPIEAPVIAPKVPVASIPLRTKRGEAESKG